ncbi:hypothetical protein PMJ10TS2_78480 (plasmid) [Paenibacillus melissococcoides]
MDILVSPDPSCPPLANRTDPAAATRHPGNQATPLFPGRAGPLDRSIAGAPIGLRQYYGKTKVRLYVRFNF